MPQYLVHPYYFSVKKRILDVSLSLIGIVLLSPFFAITYLFFIAFVGRPFIFKQKRMGKNKDPFIIYKIRTMKLGSEKKQNKFRNLSIAPYPMFKIEDDPRFISFGKILSKFGLDELPQIFNILKGDMSFVGPRPLPINEAKKLSPSWDFRYNVKPGILSKWALSSDRYESLASWKKLEGETLESGSLKEDALLILRAINQTIIKQFLAIIN